MARSFHYYTGDEVRAPRRAMGMSQATFWAVFQTVQSVGSRYETGCEIPGAIQRLLNIVFMCPARSARVVEALRNPSGQRAKR